LDPTNTGLTNLGSSIKEGMIAIAGGGEDGNEIISLFSRAQQFF
jgi:hypothetical protein